MTTTTDFGMGQVAPTPQLAAGGEAKARRTTMIWNYVLMAVLAVMFLFPWFWTLMSSLKRPAELYFYPPPLFPEVPKFSNYLEIFEKVPFGRWYINSFVVVALTVTGTVISATLVSYAFSRFRWHGRDLLFGITLATMMLPAEVTLIPQYLLYKQLGWLNSIRPLWVPAWFGGSAFSIFLLRQFIMSLPREFDEAATIDGANPLRILLQVLLPLMQPVLATVAVITFIWSWNDFMGPLIYLASPEKFTLSLGLRFFMQAPGGATWGVTTEHWLMASCVLSTIPIIALFFAAQQYFVQGIVMSGIKG